MSEKQTIEVPVDFLQAVFAWAYCPTTGGYLGDRDFMPFSMESTCEDLVTSVAELTGIHPLDFEDEHGPIPYARMLELFDDFLEKENLKKESQEKITEMFSG